MQNVYLIYDIGKTNKKCFVFTANGTVVEEYVEQFIETTDEDGFACDDVAKIEEWVLGRYALLLNNENYTIKGINFATYGASFVHIDVNGKPLTPLYNYLKLLPKNIETQFLQTYFNNNAQQFSLTTASPLMGMLNSGLQLYWLKNTNPKIWDKIQYSLHLPQYLSYLFSKIAVTDYTSLGCHTGLWNFTTKNYQQWVTMEGIDKKLAPFQNKIFYTKNNIAIGSGLHDSSAALITYLNQFKEAFVLISTGTWCINLNPFNESKLTNEQLQKDCLCYLQESSKPVKASRIFLGKEHDYQIRRIAQYFKQENDFCKKTITTNTPLLIANNFIPACMEGTGPMPNKQVSEWDLSVFSNANEAYLALVQGLVNLLKISIDLIDSPEIQNFYIDGGFAGNKIFFYYLQQHFPNKTIKTVDVAQATAYGAFLHLQKLIS